MTELTRRRFVLTGSMLTAVSLAGCTGNNDDEEVDPDTPEGRIDSYLQDNDADLYDGDVTDLTGDDTVTIDVGAGDEGLAFGPPAFRIDAGTTVVWEWTGEGGEHNVVPATGSDFDDFGDDETVDAADHSIEDTFDESGVGLYLCEPHRAVGMHGGFIVE